MPKYGQPDDPTILTSGYRTVHAELINGTAQKSGQAHAANWLRDLYRHRNIGNALLEQNSLYQSLQAGTCTAYAAQRMAAAWISNLIDGVLSEDEQGSQDAATPQNLSANDRQVAGDHYNKRPVQHWDFVVSHDFSYLGGQATKYVSRWRDKNGVVDLQKAMHFIEKMEEVHEKPPAPIDLGAYLTAQELGWEERIVVAMIYSYEQTLNPYFLRCAREALARLLDKQKAP